MTSRIVAAVAIASILSGCTHVHRIDPATSRDYLDYMNRDLERRRVSIELAACRPHPHVAKLRAERVRVAADSTSLTLLREPGEITAVWGQPVYRVRRDTTLATLAISQVATTKRSLGALDGTLLGVGMGVTLGAFIGAIGYRPDPWLASGMEPFAASTIILGVVGTVVGLVAGSIAGSTEVYEFVHR